MTVTIQAEMLEDQRVTLLVAYGGKAARITLPVPEPLFDREPGVETYRRELHSLLAELEAWVVGNGEITWLHQG